MLPRLIPQGMFDIAFCTVFLGANDACTPESGDQHITLDEYRTNLIEIIRYLRSIDESLPIILITPPAVDHIQWPSRHDSLVSKYADIVRELGPSFNVEVLDLWNLSAYDTSLSAVVAVDLHDGLHLGATGNDKLLEGLKVLLRKTHPTICPDDDANGLPNVPLHFPHWQQVVGKTREETEAIISNY